MNFSPGIMGTATMTVGDADTAKSVGSGDVPALATPRLLALSEAATVAALAGNLGEGETSVGTEVKLEHLLATPVGGRVTARAVLISVKERTLCFEVSAEDGEGRLVCRGEITRTVVDHTRFVSRLDR